MDVALILGILLAFGSLYAMITLEGAHVESLLIPAPMALVFGATIAVGIASGTVKDAVRAFSSIPRAFKGVGGPSDAELVEKVVGFAEVARRQGVLALEEFVADEKDEFLKTALQDIADGNDAEEIRVVMEDKIDATESGHRTSAKFFMGMGGYAPTIGIIGTVVSLTHVLEKLDKPDTLGPMIATAFVATLWGLLSANFIWLPIGTRLTRLAEIETARMTLQMEGMLSVQSGNPPHVVRDRLTALLPAGTKKAKDKGKKDESGAGAS